MKHHMVPRDGAGNESARYREDARMRRQPRTMDRGTKETHRPIIATDTRRWPTRCSRSRPRSSTSSRARRWSVREIVHHLADSEMTAAVRLRLLLAEDRPTIQATIRIEFARRLHYDRPHEASLELFRLRAAVDRGDSRSA